MITRTERGPSLVDELTAALAGNIRAQIDLPGMRLPSVHELAQRFGVSRTVVREALAQLRAEGVVVAKQGSGVFVAGVAGRSLRLDTMDPTKPERGNEVTGLRLGVAARGARTP